MLNLLLEIGTEELPPASVVPAVQYLASQFARQAEAERLGFGKIETFATPRRLAIRVENVSQSTPEVEETRMGPSVKVAYADDGTPTKAALGFARGQKIDVAELTRIVTTKGEYVGARIVHPGRPAAAVLKPVLEDVVSAIPWPRPMHWGWEESAWGRPVHWIVALLDSEVLPMTFAGVASGKSTWGHRFLCNRPLKVPTANAYEAIMDKASVVPRVEDRKATILRLAREAVAPNVMVEDEALLDEVVQLVEQPQVGVGTFDPNFLELPREVLISEMREHQRYFAVEDPDGKLANQFIVIYNTPVRDPHVVINGNRRVLVARLSDGRFFLDRDRERSLASRVDDLEQVVFLKQLGTIREKVDRIVMLSAYLSAMIYPKVARWARRAALLSKADLTSQMVGEFPDLQGVMGRTYATADGEPEEVAVAIEEHYQPRGAHDSVPASETGVVVSISDKIDTLAGCFAVGLRPTGTADPYGLRRAALGIIRTILEHKLECPLDRLIQTAVSGIGAQATEPVDDTNKSIDQFFRARLKAYMTERAPVDVVDAVVSTGINDLPAVVEKINALAEMREQADFEPLAVAFKRVANILKKETPDEPVSADLLEEEAERALWNDYETTKENVEAALAKRDFRAAAAALIALKEPVDRFFDDVLVMAEDPAVRVNRLALLRDLRALFNTIGDISRIQVEA